VYDQNNLLEKVPFWDLYIGYMRIIALSTLKAFWEENPEYQEANESQHWPGTVMPCMLTGAHLPS
jgi:hypothetical protein